MLRKSSSVYQKKWCANRSESDGLAAGKGVVVATTVKEALDAAEQMLNQHRFGNSSKKSS